MLGAILNDVGGIDGECGGCCSCGTCHVYVDEAYLAKLRPPEASENAVLDGVAAGRRANSRLGCQIILEPALDGLVVRIPSARDRRGRAGEERAMARLRAEDAERRQREDGGDFLESLARGSA